MLMLSDDLRRQLELAALVRDEAARWRQAGEPQLGVRLYRLAVILTDAALLLRDLNDLNREG